MKYAVDLHIHSCLSPCADKDMTPNNIVNMALLKGLDIIAVTDHNSVENLEAVLSCSARRDLLVIPGMELETREEVHLVCLFPSLNEALIMQRQVNELLPAVENREDIFGQQLVMDKEDKVIRNEKRLLMTAADMSMEEAFNNVTALGGIAIPAHVDRQSYSIISNLGIIPEELKIKYLEVSRNCDLELYIRNNPYLERYCFIKSSDAHYLGDIFERESFMELEERSSECLIEALKAD